MYVHKAGRVEVAVVTEQLADLVGQSILLRIPGLSLTEEVREALARIRPGGVDLFSANISGPEQLTELTAALQECARSLGLPPLLIGVDQEGGMVGRLPAPYVLAPSQMAQAATGDPDVARQCALLTSRQLRASGVNTNFAPVLDVNVEPRNSVIGTRAFAADPETVTRFGLAALQGYAEGNVIATVKHFPGHGDTAVDSHLGLPVLDFPFERLERVELAPFAAAIRAGVPAVMTAHIVFRALDEQPATLSRAILSGLLRERLGFEGVIFTDALAMRAIADRYGVSAAGVRAVAAGADVLLPLGTLAGQQEVAQALSRAVASGEIDGAQPQAARARLDRLRLRYRVGHEQRQGLDFAALEAEGRALACRATTILGDRGLVPLPEDCQLALVDCESLPGSDAEELSAGSGVERALARAFPSLRTKLLSPRLSVDVRAEAVALAAGSKVVLFVTRNGWLHPEQLALGQELVGAGRPVLHAALRSPYDAGRISGVAATILTYGDPRVSQQALAAVLSGQATAGGRPPVDVSAQPHHN